MKKEEKTLHKRKRSNVYINNDHLIQCFKVDEVCFHEGHLIYSGKFQPEENVGYDCHHHQIIGDSPLTSNLSHCIKCYVEGCEEDHFSY